MLCYCKLPQHLRSYYKVWNDICNEKNTIASNEAGERIKALLQPQSSKVPNICAPHAQPLEDSISAPRLPAPQPELNTWHLSKILHEHSTHRTSLLMKYTDTTGSTDTSSMQNKRPAWNHSEVQVQTTKRQRTSESAGGSRRRHCTYCHSAECAGRWKVDKCLVRTAKTVSVHCSVKLIGC